MWHPGGRLLLSAQAAIHLSDASGPAQPGTTTTAKQDDALQAPTSASHILLYFFLLLLLAFIESEKII